MHRKQTVNKLFFVAILCQLLQAASPLLAQNADSLRKVAEARQTEDTTKVMLYARSAMAYRYSNADSVIAMANKGLQLATKLHFDQGRAENLLPLTVAHLMMNDLDKSMVYCNEAIDLAGKTNDKPASAQALFYKGTILYNSAKYSDAIAWYTKSVQVCEGIGNYRLLGNALTNMGNCYSAQGNYPEATNYFLKGLKVREQMNDKAEIAVSLGNLGQAYSDMDQFDKALDYVKRSIAILEQTGDKMSMSINYENAGGVYASIKDYPNAIKSFKKALSLTDSAGYTEERGLLYVNLGEVYVEAGDFDEAMKMYQLCLADTNFTQRPSTMAMVNRGLGRIYVHQGKVAEGIKLLLKAQNQFDKDDLRRVAMENAIELSDAYAKVHDFEHALQYHKVYYNLKDSISNEKKNLKVQQLQFDYELQKKQNQIELLNKDKVIEQIRTWALVTGLALLWIIVILLYRSRQQEKRRKEIIASQMAKLDELNRYKDKIFSVLSHDLSGPLNTLSAIMSLLNSNDITELEFHELKGDVDKQLSSVTQLLDNLLKWSKNHLLGSTSVKPEKLNLQRLAEQSLALIEPAADKKKIKLENNVAAGTTAMADAGQIDIVLRNLISNALKFTPPGGRIQVGAATEGSRTKIWVSDTGIGMSPEKVKTVFTATPDNSTYGTSGEKGIGLGLLLCYEFVTANGGTITVTSEQGKGTRFEVELAAA